MILVSAAIRDHFLFTDGDFGGRRQDLERPYFRGLFALRTIDNLEFDSLPVVKRFITVSGDLGVVDENIIPVVKSYEPIAFFVAEPLDRTL